MRGLLGQDARGERDDRRAALRQRGAARRVPRARLGYWCLSHNRGIFFPQTIESRPSGYAMFETPVWMQLDLQLIPGSGSSAEYLQFVHQAMPENT